MPPTLGQMIAAIGTTPEWTAVDPGKLLWDDSVPMLYIDGEPVFTGTPASGDGGFFTAGAKEFHFYNEGDEVGRINDSFFNTGFGINALSSITPSGSQGKSNTAFGESALQNTTTGRYNTAIGEEALFSNVVGEANIAVGCGALYFTKENDNTAIGEWALGENVEGSCNIAVGSFALTMASGGDYDNWYNIAIGTWAMGDFVGGQENTAIGESALGGEGTGDYNIAIGAAALGSATNEDAWDEGNVAIGGYALWGWDNFGREYNVAIGYEAMTLGHVANHDVAIGSQALKSCYDEELSVAIGTCALYYQVAGVGNVAVGAWSGKDSINLSYNTFLGYDTMTDQMNGHGGSTAKHYHDITPAPGIERSYVEYAFSFVFDGVDESNLIPDNTYFSLPGSYGDGKTYEMHLTAVPLCTTTDSPRNCTARKIYRYYIGYSGEIEPWQEYQNFRLVGTINDNSTVQFLDSMPYSTLLTQPEYKDTGLSGSIALGSGTMLRWGKQLVIGGGSTYNPVKEAWLGGIFGATPQDFTVNPTGGYGSNVAGANLILAGGRSTGTADGGSIKFQVTPASGGSNAHWNSLADALEIDSDKVVRFFNDTLGAYTPTLGTGCPASGETPYTWLKIKTSDDSVGYIPVWK